MVMRRSVVYVILIILGCGIAASIWYARKQNTFMFTVDMPPGFKYKAAVYYVPAPGETCTVATKDNLAPTFNYRWWQDYKPDFKVPIYRTRNGCPLVVKNIRLDIYGMYGKSWDDFGRSGAQVVFKKELSDEIHREFFDASGVSTFTGECEWWFRTSGKTRVLRKLLNCKDLNQGRPSSRGVPIAAYTFDQLANKTIKMKVVMAKEETPYYKRAWVKFEDGWKRCMGEGFEDQHAFCDGNEKDFSHFIMSDGTPCTIYPGCTE